jgi:hypothetical protein
MHGFTIFLSCSDNQNAVMLEIARVVAHDL